MTLSKLSTDVLPVLVPLIFLFPPPSIAAESFEKEIEGIRDQHHLPALAVLMMQDGKVVAEQATGVRKHGAPETVTTGDVWHIGSCTKSMTATLAAMLVEQGKLRWDTTVGEIFPDWKSEMNAAWREVTLQQLLTHRAGAPGDAPADLWAEAWKHQGTPTEQRLAFVHGLVTRAPAFPPGSKFEYSNQGYSIAGAMLEKVTGKPWEGLMQDILFTPLGMKTAGFGAPATPGEVNQPWGHTGSKNSIVPVPPGPAADNPAAIGPGGTVHCSLADFARYASIHATGEEAGWGSLKPADFHTLHTTPAGQDYAMGWGVTDRPWAGGTAWTHNGSNTMFYFDVWIAPKKKAVFISATNIGGDEAAMACDEAVSALITRYLK